MAAGMLSLAVAAMLLQCGVEGSKARRVWHRREEVGPRVFDQRLDLALVVPLARPAKAIVEQIMAQQFGEGPRACPLAVTQNARHRDLQIVIQDRQRNAAEESKGRNMAIQECLRRLCRVGLDEAGIRVRQVEAEHVQLHPHAADHPNALT